MIKYYSKFSNNNNKTCIIQLDYETLNFINKKYYYESNSEVGTESLYEKIVNNLRKCESS